MSENDILWELYCAFGSRNEEEVKRLIQDDSLYVSGRRHVTVAGNSPEEGNIVGDIIYVEADGVYGLLTVNTDSTLVTYEADEVFALYAWEEHTELLRERFDEVGVE